MTYTQIAILPISLMLLVLAVVILAGKGDSLIAGYIALQYMGQEIVQS